MNSAFKLKSTFEETVRITTSECQTIKYEKNEIRDRGTEAPQTVTANKVSAKKMIVR